MSPAYGASETAAHNDNQPPEDVAADAIPPSADLEDRFHFLPADETSPTEAGHD